MIALHLDRHYDRVGELSRIEKCRMALLPTNSKEGIALREGGALHLIAFNKTQQVDCKTCLILILKCSSYYLVQALLFRERRR